MRPILFNTGMVRAIIDGRKTVTRRLAKFMQGWNPEWTGYIPDGAVLYGSNNIPAVKAPYRPGDILYVRETWGYRTCDTPGDPSAQRLYKADYPDSMILNVKWRPSIHMPKDAARLFLRVTGVRAERLQEITEEQAGAEGAKPFALSFDPEETPEEERTWHEVEGARDDFITLWDSTIKKAELPRYGWEANPWVWAIAFERIDRETALKGEN